MNCRRIRKLIPLLSEGDLESDLELRVNHHLTECQGCKEMSLQYSSTVHWLRAVSDEELDEDLFTKLRASVQERVIESNRPILNLGLFWERFGRGIAIASAALLVGALLIWFYAGRQRPENLASTPDAPEPSVTPVPGPEPERPRIPEVRSPGRAAVASVRKPPIVRMINLHRNPGGDESRGLCRWASRSQWKRSMCRIR